MPREGRLFPEGYRKMKSRAVSGIMLSLLLIGMLALAFDIQPVKASGTIYIRADGSVEGTTYISSVDNITYTFTANINDEIVVERDNVVVDGTGHTVQGTGSGTGIALSSRRNVTIKNMEIHAFNRGIYLDSSSNSIISGNNITDNNWHGIYLHNSSSNTISGNNITDNNWHGIYLHNSSSNTISGNNITDKPSWNYGILLDESSNNAIFNNNIGNVWAGILLCMQSNPSSNNSISRNNIRNNYYGVWLNLSSFNNVSGNTITGNDYGIRFYYYSENNSISENNITANKKGAIWFYSSSNNSIYHNNFVNNTHEVYDFLWDYPSVEPSINIWDDGYPSGGNYWSNYTSVDVKNGPNQDHDGSDGIGDTPFVIYANNTDRYPLMNPWPCEITPPASAPVGGKAASINTSTNKSRTSTLWIWLTTFILSLAVTVVYVKKRKRESK